MWLYFITAAAAAAKSLQSGPTLCSPIDSSPSGSPVPRILQARTLEWVAISFSKAWKWKVKLLSRSVVSDPQGPHGLQPTRLLRPWDFPGKSTGVGCHCLLHHFPHHRSIDQCIQVFLLLVCFVFVLIRDIRARKGKEKMSSNYRYYDSILRKSVYD